MTKQEIINIGVSYGWDFRLDDQPNPFMLSFFIGDMRINVYHTTMTVSTSINHPVKGKCQMYRREVTSKQLRAIFQNPRVHLGKGYHRAPTGYTDHMMDQFDALQMP